eukprot:TRINITY_DN2623_c0_g1_i2.p1 TRINITY_DN2623_c0_g1~~TRINITY_DN2623_c0_g1_i2.p1  ORF type:complete len:400 (+),score=74.68 TRINITY_DN2623_c0_g1_i2:167-1366(+)
MHPPFNLRHQFSTTTLIQITQGKDQDLDKIMGPNPKFNSVGSLPSTVFLGNLAPDVTEKLIMETFSSCGPIKEVRLKRHKDTNKVKGFGFLEFWNVEGALNSIKMNGVSIMGRQVKLEFSDTPKNGGASPLPPEPKIRLEPPISKQPMANYKERPRRDVHQEPQRPRPEGCTTVFIGNLSDEVDDDTIFNIFTHCGTIKEIRWQNDKEGNFKGCGFVEFFEEHATFKAAQMNGIDVLGREMRVDYATNKPGTKQQKDPIPRRPVYNTQPPPLPVHSAALGLIPNISMPPPRTHPHPKPPNKIRNVIAEPQKPRPPGCKTIFIGNLSDQVENDIILETFSSCGNIKEIRWLNCKVTGRFKGCGFVEFFEEDATIKAAALNGTLVCGQPMRVDYSAPPKGG